MTTTTFTVTEIALNKLDVAAANVRRTGRGNGIEELAASIAAHGLLQSLVVRPTLDDSGAPIGRYEVVAGGRRLAALKRLAKRKAFGKTRPVPCRVLDGEDAGEASLAENVVRLDMHPADQFEAFARLHQDGQGLGIEDIAARFGVSGHTVRQRLRLSAVSLRLLRAAPAAAPRAPGAAAETVRPAQLCIGCITDLAPARFRDRDIQQPCHISPICAAISNPLPPEGIHPRDFVSARGLADIWILSESCLVVIR